jgi:hypothetical protein
MKPQWEHGYRCHGYWLGVKRVGYVGLCPYTGGPENVKDNGYGWGVSVHGTGHDDAKGRTRTLRAAKRAVEREYARLTAERKSGEA